MKTIGYIRVSTDEQANHGVSLPAQRQKLEQYAELYGLELIGIIEDAGQSAKSLNRPGIQEALGMLRSGAAECILVAKLDRLTRNVMDFKSLVLEFFGEKSKYPRVLKSVTDSVDTASATGRFLLTMTMAMSEWERETISERTAAALQYKKAAGQVYGPVPYGYDRVGAELVRNEGEQVFVDLMQQWAVKGFGYQKIAGHLNREGVPSKRGGKWHPSTVKAVLENGLHGD